MCAHSTVWWCLLTFYIPLWGWIFWLYLRLILVGRLRERDPNFQNWGWVWSPSVTVIDIIKFQMCKYPSYQDISVKWTPYHIIMSLTFSYQVSSIKLHFNNFNIWGQNSIFNIKILIVSIFKYFNIKIIRYAIVIS